MKKDIDNFKPVEGLSSKPFYLSSPKSNKRVMITLGIILVLMGILNPVFFVLLAAYIIYCIIKMKNNNTEYNVLLSEAIDSYTSANFNKSFEILTKLDKLKENDERVKILLALISYEEGDYSKSIELLCSIKKSIIENDLDLQMKLAESYLKLNMNKQAKQIYENLLKINPRSQFLKDKIDFLS